MHDLSASSKVSYTMSRHFKAKWTYFYIQTNVIPSKAPDIARRCMSFQRLKASPWVPGQTQEQTWYRRFHHSPLRYDPPVPATTDCLHRSPTISHLPPLVPSLLVGAFGLYHQGSTVVSYLRLAVDILEQLFGEGEEEEEDGVGGDDGPAPLKTMLLALLLIVLALVLLVLMQVVVNIYRQSHAAIRRIGNPSHVVEGFGWGTLLLVILFIALCNLLGDA